MRVEVLYLEKDEGVSPVIVSLLIWKEDSRPIHATLSNIEMVFITAVIVLPSVLCWITRGISYSA